LKYLGGGDKMVGNNRIGEICFGRRFSALVIVLALLISAVPAGFLMSIGVVGESTEIGNDGNGDASYYLLYLRLCLRS
jgi:hypothetical protein